MKNLLSEILLLLGSIILLILITILIYVAIWIYSVSETLGGMIGVTFLFVLGILILKTAAINYPETN